MRLTLVSKQYLADTFIEISLSVLNLIRNLYGFYKSVFFLCFDVGFEKWYILKAFFAVFMHILCRLFLPVHWNENVLYKSTHFLQNWIMFVER